MKIYLSGKISGLSKEQYTLNFKDARGRVFQSTDCFLEDIINPLEIKHPFNFWAGYLIVDLWHLRKCTHIALQKNWIDSLGSVIEYIFAKFIFKQTIIFL